MRLWKRARARLGATVLGRYLRRDLRDRKMLTTSVSLSLNLLYALANGALGFLSGSLWFVALCGYHAILGVTRFAAVRCGRRTDGTEDLEAEHLVMVLTGLLLVLLSLVLGAVTWLSLGADHAIRYGTIVMITIALYAFSKLTMVAVQAGKHRRHPSPLLVVLRTISYAEVAASMFALQRSMLVSFDQGETPVDLFNALTGGAVCLFVLCLGVLLTRRGLTRKELRHENIKAGRSQRSHRRKGDGHL